MAKTAKNESSSSSTMIMSTATTAPNSPNGVKLKRKVPFKKVFSSSNLPLVNNNNGCGMAMANHNHHPHQHPAMVDDHPTTTTTMLMDCCTTLKPSTMKTINRGSISSIQSFNSLANQNSQLSSSLPGMFGAIEQQQPHPQLQPRPQFEPNQSASRQAQSSSSRIMFKSNSQQHPQSSQPHPQQSSANSVITANHRRHNGHQQRQPPESSASASGSSSSSSSSTSPSHFHLKNIPLGAIEPSLIGSLSTYLSELNGFDAGKFIKEIELMLKYFEDAFKKDKLELLNGSCNILIETIAVNCSRLRDAYLHLQQVQLRLQILANIHMENNMEDCDPDNNNDDDDDRAVAKRNPIIEATNELNRNLSELVKWSDEIYLRQQIKQLVLLQDMMDDDRLILGPGSIPKELLDSGTKISRNLFKSFKNLVKAYKTMENELRKCYEDYLYQNTKLVELIMAENNQQQQRQPSVNGGGGGQPFTTHHPNYHHQRSEDQKIRDSIQTLLRRRSITPPPELNYGRLDALLVSSNNNNHHPGFRTMANGSTSTISSSISSNSSQSTNSGSSLSSSSTGSSSSAGSSTMFRTHRFIPTIISHQAQKMAQHFELKKFRAQSATANASNAGRKLDSTSSLKQPKLTDNQTMLSFLFGLSGSSGGGGSLKRSESANNIHRINHNILLPSKHYPVQQQQHAAVQPPYDVIPNQKQAMLNMMADQKYRKHSMNSQEVPNGTASQCQSAKDLLKRNANSKPNSPKRQPHPQPQSMQPMQSTESTTIQKHPSRQKPDVPPNDVIQPPPLPPKTYHHQRSTTTNNNTNNHVGNSGRSSIASNTSSMSSSSSLQSTTTTASSSSSYSQNSGGRHHHYKRSPPPTMNDSDSAIGGSGASLPSSNSHESLRQQQSSSSLYSEEEAVSCLVNNHNNNSHDGSVMGVASDQNGGYSQVTLRPKKVRQRTMDGGASAAAAAATANYCQECDQQQQQQQSSTPINHHDDHRNVSPPPLPMPPNSMMLLNVQCGSHSSSACSCSNSGSSSSIHMDSATAGAIAGANAADIITITSTTNSNSTSADSSLDTRCSTTGSAHCCGCCCCGCCCNGASGDGDGDGADGSSASTSSSSNHRRSSSVIQRQVRTYRKPLKQQHTLLSVTKSCVDYSMGGAAALGRRSSLMHSISTIEGGGGAGDQPPPLPPKRNLHAYMGMVGDYTGPQLNNNSGGTSLSSTTTNNNLFVVNGDGGDKSFRSKSMFCEPPPLSLTSTASTISLSSSISTTTNTNTNTSIGSTTSLTGHSPVIMDKLVEDPDPDLDPYQHLPLAPPPPTTTIGRSMAPSPPPILPPRRDKMGDVPAPPPPPPPSILRSLNRTCQHSRPRSSTPINHQHNPHHHHHQNHGHDHHHHHHHHHCNHSPLICTKPETEVDDLLKSPDPICNPLVETSKILEEEQEEEEEAIEFVQDKEEDDQEEDEEGEEEEETYEEDVEAPESPETTCCQYCSDGTNHTEDECLLAQVELPPHLFVFPTNDDETTTTITTDQQQQQQQSATNAANMMMMADPMNIRGGTIDALLIKATHASMNSEDEIFVDCFLCTYRSFINIQDLLKKLIFRYRYFTGKTSNQTDIVHQSVARKVVGFITLLIGHIYIYDFDKHLLETMMEFIYQLVTKGDLVNAKFLREKCYEKLRHKEREFSRQNNLNNSGNQSNSSNNDANNNQSNNNDKSSNMAVSSNTPTIITNHVHLKTWSLLDFKAEHLAEQMTLLDSRLFCKIESPEILIWAKEQKEESIPNLSRFTEHFNNMSYWARSQILTCHDQKEREKYMLKFLKIMKHLRKLNNFNSFLAILSALDSAPISRLDWPKNVVDLIKEYGSLIDSSSSFRTYRNILANSKPPCIPYIGLILQDLTFVHIGNNDYLHDGKINWCKYTKQYNILCQMNQFRQCQYSINENENILMFFDRFEDHLQEDVMWQISDSLKPRITSISSNLNNNVNNTLAS